MATNTYVALDKVTVSGSSTTSITFSSIISSYTDLVIVANVTTDRSANPQDLLQLRVNADSGANYSDTFLEGDGSTASSSRHSSSNQMYIGNCGGGSSTSGQFTPMIINLQNYSNSTTYKTVLNRFSYAALKVGAYVGLWRSTAAITSVTIASSTASNFVAGSTFSLYGIAAEGVSPAAKATGGYITSDSTYYYHTFLASGTFTPLSSLSADVLVVAGGGGGGRIVAGGGGAGGLTYYASQSLTATGYTCTVGAGGAGSTAAPSAYGDGANGVNSQFGALTAAVGGGGGGGLLRVGLAGGSGGGGGGSGVGVTRAGGTGSQGTNGGLASGNISPIYEGAGGGGFSVAGSPNNTTTPGGAGGAGTNTYSTFADATGTGVSGYYAGGGGGGVSGAGYTSTNAGVGGAGGGGRGGFSNQSTTTDNAAVTGTANTGGGGGGAGNDYSGNNANTYGAAGGSGVVIVRYLKA